MSRCATQARAGLQVEQPLSVYQRVGIVRGPTAVAGRLLNPARGARTR
ncbi:MAG: hypothetical protein JWL77_6922 [Chthonomonadaceae bacterium]|nr:hypothetical protein [Chthonomonadaceae bacterium]